MKYYTQTIPYELAEKLNEKELPITMPYKVVTGFGILTPTYAEVFDWLMDKGIDIEIHVSMTRLDNSKNLVEKYYAWDVFSKEIEARGEEDRASWHEAASVAIEKALELIK